MAKKEKKAKVMADLSPEEQALLAEQQARAEKEERKRARRERKEQNRKLKKKEANKDKKFSLRRTVKETGAELKQVRWPSFSHAVKQTTVVLGVVVVFSIVLFAIDFGLSNLHGLLTRGLGRG